MPLKPHEIFDALAAASPGDTLTWTGEWDPDGRKVLNVRGEEGAPITLRGTSPQTASVNGQAGAPFVIRFETCQWFRFGNCTVFNGHNREQRGVQVFSSDHIELFDLVTRDLACDHIHTAGCNHVLVQRHRANGDGGQDMGGGKGPHAIYFTTLDDGDDCEDLVAEDCEAERIFGSCWQANGDRHSLTGVAFRRMRGREWRLGAGFNLAKAQVELEDIDIVSATGNGGVRCFDGARATLTRYSISVKGREMLEGPVSVTRGAPQSPRLDAADPPPPPPPDTGGGGEEDLATCRADVARLEAELAAANEQLAAWDRWYVAAPRPAA